MKVIITGASGVLGSAVYSTFKRSQANIDILGLAYSRADHGPLVKLDLLDYPAVEKLFTEYKPNWVIHCAAERRPDVAEKDPDGAQKLNADLPAQLAQLGKKLKYKLVYISTDYVFDGTSPPYSTSATPNPVNLYGRTKREGEVAILTAVSEGLEATVLRVPVLYGPAPKNSDTAVNILVDVVEDQSGKQYKMDHYATRYPTNVLDISAFLVRLTSLLTHPSSTTPLPPILHFSAPEPFTKYEMCLIFSKLLSLPHSHIIPDAEAPTGAAATTRPKNCQLDTSETEAFLLRCSSKCGDDGGGIECRLFEEWWEEYFKNGGAKSCRPPE